MAEQIFMLATDSNFELLARVYNPSRIFIWLKHLSKKRMWSTALISKDAIYRGVL